MRPIRTTTLLALGLAALAAAGCQSRSDQPTTAVPTQVGRATPATTASAHRATPPSRPPTGLAPKRGPAPSPEVLVGVWPAKTLQQAKGLQGGVDDGHQSWLLSPELVSTSYATAELGMFGPVAQRVGPTTYQVRPHNGEWAATLQLAQPVRQGAGGVWVVTQVERF